MKNVSDNPLLSEGHFIDVPAGKTRLKDKVDGNETVTVCKYCLEAYENGEIEPYMAGGYPKDGIYKVYAMTKGKWKTTGATSHLARCPFAPPDVKDRDFRQKLHNK